MWQGIKSIININNNNNSQPFSLQVDNMITTDPTKIANEFNKYFVNAAGKLQGKIHNHGHHFSKYLKNRTAQSFFIKPTDEYEILELINKHINYKDSGPHSIPNSIFHLIKPIISEPLSEIINLSFITGVYIENLKISRTIPIFKKKGNEHQCCNYRPISLLSNINKLIEKMMYSRVYSFLELHNSIYKNQFGFRANHSTFHALISLTEDIRQALDNNYFACGIFIDFQKAFDTVDHNILLKKLEHYGVRGLANDWFKSYLLNRKQYVSINGTDSNLADIQFGVPQGSVLGPLLFLIYINDLHQSIQYSTTRHFADDTNLVIKNNSLKQLKKQLNLDLRSLNNWLKANKISLNSGKTELIIFRHINKQINYDLKIKINGKRIYPSSHVKYLGIFIDSHLNWSFHSDALASRLSRANGMLLKIRHYVSKNTLRSIYFGIFSSLISYGAQIWGQRLNKHIHRLEKLQNKAIRIINFANFRAPVTPLYLKSKILKLSDNIKLMDFLYVVDNIKGNLPCVFNDTLQFSRNIHTYHTRGASQYKIILPKVKTETYGIKSITYQSAHFWNYIINIFPEKKLHQQSKAVCKKFVTNSLLQNYI